jgi:hypothetical protein
MAEKEVSGRKSGNFQACAGRLASLPISHQNKRSPEVRMRRRDRAGSLGLGARRRELGAWRFAQLPDPADASPGRGLTVTAPASTAPPWSSFSGSCRSSTSGGRLRCRAIPLVMNLQAAFRTVALMMRDRTGANFSIRTKNNRLILAPRPLGKLTTPAIKGRIPLHLQSDFCSSRDMLLRPGRVLGHIAVKFNSQLSVQFLEVSPHIFR